MYYFSLVCTSFPRKMGKKCGQLIKLKQTLQRFVFVLLNQSHCSSHLKRSGSSFGLGLVLS